MSQGISNGNIERGERAVRGGASERASKRRELNRPGVSTDKLPARFNGTPCENDDREIKGLFSGTFLLPGALVRNKTRPGLVTFCGRCAGSRSIGG